MSEKTITRKNGDTFTVKHMSAMRTVEAGRLMARCKIQSKLSDPALESAGYLPVALARVCLVKYVTVTGANPLSGLEERDQLDVLADIPGLTDEVIAAANDFTKEIVECRERDRGFSDGSSA